MTGNDALFEAVPAWMHGTGPDSDVVISSRVRLARNLEGKRFPHTASGGDRASLLDTVFSAVKDLNGQTEWGEFSLIRLDDMPDLDRQALVEKHLISPQLAAHPRGRAFAAREDEMCSLMVNEEDHLRLQCLFSGFELEQAWVAASGLDDALEARLDLAFCPRRGYLTACPTNVGTGLRASVMMHLPGLVIAGLLDGVFTAAAKMGMVKRGLYGEGSEGVGNIFQLSNQVTLGQSEEEIISNLQIVTRQIIDQERSARTVLLRDMKVQMEDRVYRSYGVMRHARILRSGEAMRKWSDVRFGRDLGILESPDLKTLNSLIVTTRPAFLQRALGRTLGPYERDLQRAALVRRAFGAPVQDNPGQEA